MTSFYCSGQSFGFIVLQDFTHVFHFILCLQPRVEVAFTFATLLKFKCVAALIYRKQVLLYR